MPFEVRAIPADEMDDLLARRHRAFGAAPPVPADRPRAWARAELDRTRSTFDNGALIGASRTYTFELTMPGGAVVPAAAVSLGRRGADTRPAGRTQPDDRGAPRQTRDAVSPAAILTASESSIYGRYGYGVATWRLGLSVERAHGQFARPVDDDGRIRFVTYEEAGKILPAVYETVRRERAGMVTRPEPWWSLVLWPMTQADKAHFVVVHEDALGHADGVRRVRDHRRVDRGFSNRTLTVFDIQSTNAAARAALWQYLLGVDLVGNVSADRLPVDEPLRLLLRDPRRPRVDFVSDDMWLAPLDPRALLEAWRYSVFDGHLVIEVTDLGGRAVRFAVEGNEQAAHAR